jgi:hypothetical protein
MQLETTERQQLIGIAGLYDDPPSVFIPGVLTKSGVGSRYVLYFTLYRDASDKKLFRAIFEIYKKTPIIHVYGNVIWVPTDFLNRNVPAIVKSQVKYDRDSIMRSALKESDATFDKCERMHQGKKERKSVC